MKRSYPLEERKDSMWETPDRKLHERAVLDVEIDDDFTMPRVRRRVCEFLPQAPAPEVAAGRPQQWWAIDSNATLCGRYGKGIIAVMDWYSSYVLFLDVHR